MESNTEKINKLVEKLLVNPEKNYTSSVSELHKMFSEQYTKRELDFAYLLGVFNVSGIDGMHSEIQRLKELGKEPHDIINSLRKQK